MPLTTPPVTETYAKKVIAVLDVAPADPTAPTLAELNAATFITCHIYGDWLVSTPTQNVVDGQRKSCSATTPQRLGTVTYAVNEVSYSFVPQSMGTPGESGNEAIELLTAGSQHWVAEAHGLDGKTDAFVADDVVNLYHVEFGVQRRGEAGAGSESAEAQVTQSGVLVDGSEPYYDLVVPSA